MIARKKIFLGISAAILLVGVFWFFNFKKSEAPKANEKTEITETLVQEKTPTRNEIAEEKIEKAAEEKKPEEKSKKAQELPEKVSIQVPFISQAPLGRWDEIHEETCEEASLLMVEYYLEDRKLTPMVAEKEIQKMVKFQKEKRGDFKDTNAQETADLGKDFFGIKNFRVIYDFSKEDLKKQLALKRPIIIPAAGRKLGNPNFTPPGPLYHNLVLTGYSGNNVITNDPGTRKGENYIYDIDVLYSAIHNFTGLPEDIESGRKAMIVLE